MTAARKTLEDMASQCESSRQTIRDLNDTFRRIEACAEPGALAPFIVVAEFDAEVPLAAVLVRTVRGMRGLAAELEEMRGLVVRLAGRAQREMDGE